VSRGGDRRDESDADEAANGSVGRDACNLCDGM